MLFIYLFRIEFFDRQAIIEFVSVGPVEHTECRIEEGDINGPFSDCKFDSHLKLTHLVAYMLAALAQNTLLHLHVVALTF